MKEYGSSIQKMVNYLLGIEDRVTRTRQAHILVELMRQLHPAMKEGQDYYNKLWDDLYIMSGFRLDVDSPYPPPSPDVLGKQPQKVGYQYHNLKYKHFGQNINLLVDRAFQTEDADERRAFVSYLVRLMRTFYMAWNKENVEDETIYQSILDISKGKLAPDIQLIRNEGLVEGSPRERADEQPQRITNQKSNRSFANNYGQQRNRQDRNNGGGNNNNNRSQFRGGNNNSSGGGNGTNNSNRNPFRGGGNNPGNNSGGNNRRRGR